ncbi:hypothetical protein [Streptomyces sp. ML-6]|uniref:hypothetical protein n=1 Tax=Streptomyces sp. ML-6 TaxID=2982693 RepID=UPI0024BFE064|nr:hypothetical protein [Streptomyces sp. ML-6]MDK0525087.1 hypothetical protein [Streptomyces sp. ML-6]
MTMPHELADREQQMRANLETGFTDQEWAVGMVLCPAREKCTSPAGMRALFKPLTNGRLPMHRDWLGKVCAGANKKPTTPPLQLRSAVTEEPSR